MNIVFKMARASREAGPAGGKGMIRIRCTAALLAALMAMFAGTAQADEAALKAKLVELEQRQAAMQKEMDELRAQLEAKPPAETKVVEVERKQNVITEEVRKIREAISLPESKELKSEYGLGPAASKVYGVNHGVSIGSYGEYNYRGITSDNAGEDDE